MVTVQKHTVTTIELESDMFAEIHQTVDRCCHTVTELFLYEKGYEEKMLLVYRAEQEYNDEIDVMSDIFGFLNQPTFVTEAWKFHTRKEQKIGM